MTGKLVLEEHLCILLNSSCYDGKYFFFACVDRKARNEVHVETGTGYVDT